MKRKSMYILLGCEAALLIALSFFASRMPQAFAAAAAFPFEQIAIGLRALSLSGSMGNGAALLVWVAVSLLPVAYALKSRGDAERKWENTALWVLSAALFAALYFMVNPGVMVTRLPMREDGLTVLKAALGCAVWSIAVCYAVLRLLRLFQGGEATRLLKYLRSMLYVLCALFVSCIAYACTVELIENFNAAQKDADKAFALLRFAVSALPYAMDIAVTLAGMTLLEKMLADERESAVIAVDKLSKVCCCALALITAADVALNCAQLIFMGNLSIVSAVVELPLMSLAFVLFALLLARLIKENKRLSDDNELII